MIDHPPTALQEIEFAQISRKLLACDPDFISDSGATVHTIVIHNQDETETLGRRLGEMLFPGAVVALVGQLGAGKTLLVRAIAVGLGMVNVDAVSSPTFVLIQEYNARLPIYHFDAYRLIGADELLGLGVHEYFESSGVSLVEWADKVRSALPKEYLEISIDITGEESRRVEMIAHGTRYEAIAAALSKTC